MDHTPILTRFGITELNDMQNKMLETVKSADNIVLISPTGSGKTLGYLLPLLPLLKEASNAIQVMILVPSRELALQIEKVFRQIGTPHKITCCYGGHSMRIEKNNLLDVPAVLAGTPGRISDHLQRGNIAIDTLQVLILDEFDKSLEMGFQEDMKFILQQCKNVKKRMLTSATTLKEIPEFAGVQNSVVLNYTRGKEESKSLLKLKVVHAKAQDKLQALLLLLGSINAVSTLVFCNHREAVNRISDHLKGYQIDHGVYHGGLEQPDRERVMIKFRNGSIKILVTTDLASRGLDIPEVDAIVHYQLPATGEVMIHRNGRTARMNMPGTAYFLLAEDEYLPDFVKALPDELRLPEKVTLPRAALWKTMYIGAGRKDKINKTDIVGMILQKGGLQQEELGKVDVLDHSSFVAIKASRFQKILTLLKEERIKNKRVKIGIG